MNKPTKAIYSKHKISNIVSVTKIVMIHHFEFQKDFQFQAEMHNFWEMIYIDSGQALVTRNDETYALKQGDLFFVEPNVPHAVHGNGTSNFTAFIISFTSSSSSLAVFLDKILTVPPLFRKYIAHILQERDHAFLAPKNNPYSTEMKLKPSAAIGSIQLIRIYLEQFLILMLRSEEENSSNLFPDGKTAENPIVVSVKDILRENVYSSISVGEICNKLNYSRTYISRTFKQHCNCTINTYYNELKISEAKKLIYEGRYNFTQISAMLGFDNPHYFTRVFKRVTNMTPTEYSLSSSI